MKHLFCRFRLGCLYWCLVCFLPLATHAKPAGEIIFRHPLDFFELWTGNVQEGHGARRVFRQKLLIVELSVQKDDRYLVAVAERFVDDELHLHVDAYLLDKKRPNAEAKNLTQGRYGEILDAAISRNGDVVFTNRPFVPVKNGKVQERGPFLIRKHEATQKHNPKARLLKQVDADYVDWGPHRNQIAYSTDTGIFLFNILTAKVSQIIKDGYRPVFSPDGKHLAFLTGTKPTKLGILSLANLNLKHIEIEGGVSPIYLTWSPDGRYIVYTLAGPNRTSKNFAVPIAGGRPERILEMYAGGVPLFEWTHTAKAVTHAVKPENKLTTLWGKLKQQDLR